MSSWYQNTYITPFLSYYCFTAISVMTTSYHGNMCVLIKKGYLRVLSMKGKRKTPIIAYNTNINGCSCSGKYVSINIDYYVSDL